MSLQAIKLLNSFSIFNQSDTVQGTMKVVKGCRMTQHSNNAMSKTGPQSFF